MEQRQETVSVELIAQLCHEANRAICESTGDRSQVAWADAAAWQKESALAGVRVVLDFPAITPEELHEEWVKAKRADGWVWGPQKDAIAKTHPCMVMYDSLPSDQRTKDFVFRAIVLTLSQPVISA